MILDKAIEVLKIEAEGILSLINNIDHNFSNCINMMLNTKGNIVVSGIGKAGIIGRKISATLNSIGTKSVFLHPVEAVHGDLGIICRDDIFMAVSSSGETDELNFLLPKVSKIGCSIIALTGDTTSTLSKNSDIVINVSVKKEACPFGLIPTTSTTALLAMGDALAVVLVDQKQIKSSDFKKNHPGGMLGQRLSSNVKDIMLKGDKIPIVMIGTNMRRAILKMDQYALGVILISDNSNRLLGIITDGDLRRALCQGNLIFDFLVDDIMIKNPRSFNLKLPAYDALNIMEKYQITILPVTDPRNKIKGVLHLHDILGKGAFRF